MGKRAPTRSSKGKVVTKKAPKNLIFGWIVISVMVLSVLAYVVVYRFDNQVSSANTVNGYTFSPLENYFEISNSPRANKDTRGMIFFTIPYDYSNQNQIAQRILQEPAIYLSIDKRLNDSAMEVYSSHEVIRSLLGDTLFYKEISPLASITYEYNDTAEPVMNCETSSATSFVISFVDSIQENRNLTDGIYIYDNCVEIVASTPLEMARLTDSLRFALLQ